MDDPSTRADYETSVPDSPILVEHAMVQSDDVTGKYSVPSSHQITPYCHRWVVAAQLITNYVGKRTQHSKTITKNQTQSISFQRGKTG